MPKYKLDACARCGSVANIVNNGKTGTNLLYRVRCEKCPSHETKAFRTARNAVRVWNEMQRQIIEMIEGRDARCASGSTSGG